MHRRRTVLAAFGAAALLPSAARPEARTIAVVAKKFEFVPAEIRVGRGEAVVLELSAPEVPMGFSLPDFGLRADLLPGRPVRLAFSAERAGRFAFVCDVFCGSGHEQMSGSLVVGV